MNRNTAVWTLLTAAGLALAPLKTQAHYEVAAGISISAVGDFDGPLGAYGTWVEVGSYGRCWRPAYVAAGWRPYCAGHWEWTDDGWFWVGDEPWSWACDHYGRWVDDSYNGWVWVPEVEWAPCWVEWRCGDGYVGWAPLPPECVFREGDIDVDRVRVAPSAFVFVAERHFCDPIRPAAVIVNDETILRKTVNVTKIRVVNHVVTVNGPDVGSIRQRTGRTVQRAEAASLWRDGSERVISRASQENRPAPPVVRMPARATPAQRTAAPVTDKVPRQSSRETIGAPSGAARAAPPAAERSRGSWWWPFGRRRQEPAPPPAERQAERRAAPATGRSPGNWWPPGWRSHPPAPGKSPPENSPSAGRESRQPNSGYFYHRQPGEPPRERAAPSADRSSSPGKEPRKRAAPGRAERGERPAQTGPEEKGVSR